MTHAAPTAPAPQHRPWKNRAILFAVGALVLVVMYFILAAVIPRWWSHRIGDMVGGSITAGTLLGLLVGAVFTFLPVMVARLALLKRAKWKVKLGILLGALVLATPNLMTLSIVLGNSAAAHAGERELDTDGPAFRGGSLVGAIFGLLLAVGALYLLHSRKVRGRELKKLRGDAKRRDRDAKAATGDNSQPH